MKYFSTTLLFLFPLFVFSQSLYTISGIIKDDLGSQVPYANIDLGTGLKYTVSDKNGRFVIENIQKASYEIKVSAVGFQTNIQNVDVLKNLSLEITLSNTYEGLNDVVVYGKTTSEKQSEKAITINSIDVKKLQNQSLGTEEVLKTSTGLAIRQSGGLGSDVNINLNGLSGNAVRVYYDGIPIEVYGEGVDLNTIPIDAVERADVYKGVLPVDIGTDALGGGINIIPLKQSKEYLRASYTLGSFNTHRITFNGFKNISDRIALSTISYLNYSDNDYTMKNILSLVEIELPDGSPGVVEELIDARRFHDKHVSGFIEAKLHIKNIKWADRLELASSYSGREDEIQHGASIQQTAIGEAEVNYNAFVQRIDYRKAFFKDRLQTRYYGTLSSVVEKINDSTTNIYNWKGERLQNRSNSTGAEFSRPTLQKRETLGTAHRVTLNYKLKNNVDFKISNFYQYSKIDGEDPLAELTFINNEFIDLNTIPSKINKNIFGAGLNADFFDAKLKAITFFKNYNFNAESIDILQNDATRLPIRKVQNNNNGYGLALKYQINPNIFVRTSFEKAIRIPTESEIFGNQGTIIPNFELEPEESSNWNLGAQFEKRLKNDQSISLNINGFIRNRKNLIRTDVISVDNIQYINEAQVNGKGVEFGVKISPFKNATLNANYTIQSNEIGATNSTLSGEQIDLGREVPNIPLKFYNLGGKYTIKNIFKSENNLQFFWTYFFTDEFSVNTVSDINTATTDFIIPTQHLHNTGLTYILKQKGMALSFNLKNVFNAEVFDNLRIPRPGINYSFKINYSL